jgi:heptosyltransferase-1
MVDILFIKTSSLGDVVHHMPAVTDARRHLPDAHIAWMVEEPFAPLAGLHPAVNAVIPVASRRWRRQLQQWSTWREIAIFRRGLRSRSYDIVIDTQGLVRSGLLTFMARGRRHGYDRSSIREPLASTFYNRRHRVGRDLHAIARNRALTAAALGYAPEGAPDYGLLRRSHEPEATPYAVLLHGSAQAAKQWPSSHWIAVGKALQEQGCDLLLPWGTEPERARSEQLAQALPGAQVLARAPLDQVANRLAGAQLVVGLDTGLLHLAAALQVPLVAIFTASDPNLTGPVGRGPMVTVGARGVVPEPDAVIDATRRMLASQPMRIA